MNENGRRLIELIRGFAANKVEHREFCEVLHTTINQQLDMWCEDVLIGPYIPVLVEICSKKRCEKGNILEQTLNFLFSYQDDADNADKLILDFYNYLRRHVDIKATPRLDRSYGFQYVKHGQPRSFAIIWAQGEVVLPDDTFTKDYALSTEYQDRIRIPFYRGNSTTVDYAEPGDILDFRIPPHLRSRSGTQDRAKPKIRVRFQRQGKDLSFRLDWIDADNKSHKIKSGLLSNEFDRLVEQEETGLDNIEKWRHNLRRMIDIYSDFILECEKSDRLKIIKDRLEARRAEALKVCHQDDEGEGWKMFSRLLEDWLELGPKVIVFSSIRIVEMVAGGLSDEVQPLVDAIIEAHREYNEPRKHQLLDQLAQVRVDALDKYYENRSDTYARLELDRNILRAFSLFDSGNDDFPINRSQARIRRLTELVESILSNYSDKLTPTQISELRHTLGEVREAAGSGDDQALTEKVSRLERRLVGLGYPATVAIINSLNDEDFKETPTFFPRLREFAGQIKNSMGRGDRSELSTVNREFLDEFRRIVGELPPAEKKQLSVELAWLQKIKIFPVVTDLPVLALGREHMQMTALLRKAAEFKARWKSNLSAVLLAKLDGLIHEAENAIQSNDTSQMIEFANQIIYTLFDAGAPFIAFMADSYFEDNERTIDGRSLNEEAELMVTAYRQSISKRAAPESKGDEEWRSLAYNLTIGLSRIIESRIDTGIEQDKQLRFEKEILEGLALSVAGNSAEAVQKMKESLAMTGVDNVDKIGFFADLIEKFLNSEHAELLTPYQRKKLQSGLHSLQKSVAVNAQMFKKTALDLRDNLTSAAAELVTGATGHPIPDLKQRIYEIITHRLPDSGHQIADETATMVEILVAGSIPEHQVDDVGLLAELGEPYD